MGVYSGRGQKGKIHAQKIAILQGNEKGHESKNMKKIFLKMNQIIQISIIIIILTRIIYIIKYTNTHAEYK